MAGSVNKVILVGNLGKDPKVANDPGREVRLCCKGCLDDFKADPAKYVKKLDDALAAKSKK